MKPGITLVAGKLTLGMLRRIARGGISVALDPGTRSAIDASRAAVQEAVDHGAITLARKVPYTERDIIAHSPVTEKHLEGAMTVEALCEAIMLVSDNAAANVLLSAIGGPAKVTAFARVHGDSVTRLDRTEPDLNSDLPGDPRDTTTPAASVKSA